MTVVRKKHHGMRKTATYKSWADMIQRCTNPKTEGYENYGGRGITVCPEWFDFRNFLRDMGPKPSGKTFDRADVNGNYEPGNCRWTTYEIQAQNKRVNKLNKSGIEGVWWDKQKQRFVVKMNLQRKVCHLGTFSDFFEACCTRKSAEQKYRQT